ncbi:fumarate reductase subunit C [Insolitispirillum peregrinum]|uniref:hypothetical protein n=1 Tax=Insolitispirillum peregrinum TaxID=80876 RepID=UPI00361BB6FE
MSQSYKPVFPKTWWLQSAFYTRYMIREASSFFVATYSALLIIGLWRLNDGPQAWDGFLHALQSPFAVLYHLLALLFTLYHTVTWFAVTPRTMPVLVGDDFLPAAPIVIAQYVAWVVLSLGMITVTVWL